MQRGFLTLHCLVKKNNKKNNNNNPDDVCSAHEAVKCSSILFSPVIFRLVIKRERVSEISALRIQLALKQCNTNKNKITSPQGFFLCLSMLLSGGVSPRRCDRKTESCLELVEYILSSLTPIQSGCSHYT